MDQEKEYWETHPEPEEENDIEPELFQELNRLADNSDGQIQPGKPGSRWKKAAAFITVVVFLSFIGGNLLRYADAPDLGFLAESFRLRQVQEIQQLQEAVVTIKNNQSSGTGFNVSPDGLIITNEHVIRDGDHLLVSFSSGESFRAEPVLVIPELDLAVLDIEGADLPALTLGSADSLKPEQEVLIIGNPLGVSRVVKRGQIIGMGSVPGIAEEVILLHGPIHKGSSGSPVFNEREEVVAVIFAVLVSEEEQDGEIVGLAIPVDFINITTLVK